MLFRSGKPFRSYPDQGRHRAYPIPDRERGALTRLKGIMAKHKNCVGYVQGDPRGCSLYIVPKNVLQGQDIASVYNRGIAVC